jgi:hypothetical protein
MAKLNFRRYPNLDVREYRTELLEWFLMCLKHLSPRPLKLIKDELARRQAELERRTNEC